MLALGCAGQIGKLGGRAGLVCDGLADALHCRRVAEALDPTGEWIPVPPGAVVHNAGNPVGEAILWWNQVITDEDQIGIFIRCFVPGDGV